jgi:mannosyltransferase
MSKRWSLALLLLILLLATGLRMYRIDAQSFWHDEGLTADMAERSVAKIFEALGGDIHLPVYHLMTAGWIRVAGDSELSLRWLSVAFGVLTVALVYAVGVRLFSREVGLLGAAITAFDPFQVYYSQEARMYTMLGAFAMAGLVTFIEVLKLPAKRAAGRPARNEKWIITAYVLVHALGVYVHYGFWFWVAAENLVFLIWMLGRPRKGHSIAAWAILQIVSLGWFALWLPIVIGQVLDWPGGAERYGAGPSLLRLGGALAYGITLPPGAPFYYTGARPSQEAMIGLIPFWLLAIIGLLPPVEGDGRRLRFYERMLALLAWIFVPVGAMLVTGSYRDAFLKFLAGADAAVSLLVARGVVMGFEITRPMPLTGQRQNALMRIVVLIMAASAFYPTLPSLHNLYFDPAYARDDYRGIAQRIRAEVGPDATVIVDAPGQWETFDYYYGDPGARVVPLPLGGYEATMETLDELLATSQLIYVIYWGEAERDPQHWVETTLDARAFQADMAWYSGLRLVTYIVPAQAADRMETPLEARFGEAIRLEGYTLSDEVLTPGEALGVTLFWSCDAPLDMRYKVFVHLYAPDGTLVAQHDDEPSGDLAPTTTWTPGETVHDNHGLLLPGDLVPGEYEIAVGIYQPDSGERLPVTRDGEPSGDVLPLATLSVRQ